MLQTEAARECFVFLPLAQMRQLLPTSCVRIKKSCTQIRTGPSLCQAESGWKLPLWILRSLPRCRQWQ